MSQPGSRDRIFLNWIRSDNSLMPQNHQIHDGVLYINNVQPSDAGEYSCLGIGPTGTVLFTATARLVVIGELDSIIYFVGSLQFCGDM
jgi:hypothetical protein